MPRPRLLPNDQAASADEYISKMTAQQWALLTGWCRKIKAARKPDDLPKTVKSWFDLYHGNGPHSGHLCSLSGKVNKGTIREALRTAGLYEVGMG